MSAVMRVPWENRLAKLIQTPGGVKVSEALQRAGENLESIRDDCLEEINTELDKIERLHRSGGARPSDEIKEAMYRLSNDIHGVAGLFGLTELGQAAYSLCELIDRLRASDGWSQPAIEVHLAAFRLFRQPELAGSPEARESVLEGLRRVVDRAPLPQPPD